MSLLKTSDVKKHLSPPFRGEIHLCEPINQPDGTGFSAVEPDATQANLPDFARDYVEEHSFLGTSHAQDHPLIDFIVAQATAASEGERP